MMELKVCALVLTVISSVIANPYGYGVKGGAGAAAKAVAGASAGTFGGDAPIPVPFGSGFSGSFTKSSSSSSSSTSASSSSSSSSFTYSGYGPGGLPSLGSTGNIGCTSGQCKNSGAKEISGNLGEIDVGAGVQGYNTANAAAAVESGSEINCQGPTCISNSEKCTSGHCPTNPQIGTLPSGLEANEKCTPGQCGDNLDDIHVVGHASNTTYESKDQFANDHIASDYGGSSKCHGESCGTATTFNSQPGSAHQHTNLPGKLLPSISNYKASNGQNLPSIHLEAPKEDSPCDNGNCNLESSRPSYDNSLSSYNVPIHGTFDSNKQKPQCHDEKCASSQKGSHSTTDNALSTNSQNSHSIKGSYYPSSLSCSGPNCGSLPSGYIGDKSSTTASTDIHFGLTSPNTGSTKCNLPNCNPHYAVNPTASNVQPGHTNYAIPINTISTSNQNVPVYTGGFGAPGGVLSVNPSHTHPSPTPHNEPTNGSPSTGCKSLNCLGQASSPGAHVQPTLGDNKPNEDSKVPIYSGGFGAPAGLLKPNEYGIPASGINKPIHSVSPIHNTPSPDTTACKTGNCFGSSNIAGTTSTTTTQSGSYGIHKENDNGNTYTGGFGGPTGTLKPYEFDAKLTTKPEQSTTPSYNSQSTVPATADCKTPNCIGNAAVAGAIVGSSTQSEANNVPKPSFVIDSSSDLPLYTGGFGGPAGLLKPNEFASPHKTPGYYPSESETSQNKIPTNMNSAGCSTSNCTPHNVGTTLVTNTQSPSTSCSGSNCDSVPSGNNSDKPSTTAPTDIQFGLPSPYSDSTNCNSPSCNTYSPTTSNLQPGQTYYALPIDKVSTTTHPSIILHKVPTYESLSPGAHEHSTLGGNKPNEDSKLPIYSGGFGAPAGFLKPNDYGVPASGINNPIQSVNRIHNTPSSITIGCKMGNCFGSSNMAGTTTTTTQSGSKNDYGNTGDFGGPTSTIKPYEFDAKLTSKPEQSTTPSDNSQSTIPATADCKTPNCIGNAAVAGAVTGSSTQSGAIDVPKPNIVTDSSTDLPLYTGGFGGPAGLSKPNVFDLPYKSFGNYPSHPVTSQNKIPTNINSADCSTANCSPHSFGTPLVTNTQSPSTSCSGSNCNSVPSGYNRDKPSTAAPSGNEFRLPSSNSGSINCNLPSCKPHGPTAANVQPGQTNSGLPINIVSTPMHPSTTIHKESTYESISTGCSSPSCFGQTSLPGVREPSTFSINKLNEDANVPVYSGGFDAPTGLLKPNQYDTPGAITSKPIQNTQSPVASGCKTGNCIGSSNIAGTTSASTSQSGSYGIRKESEGDNIYTPTELSKPNKSAGCKTCSGSTVTNDAVSGLDSMTKPSTVIDSDMELPFYTGGFGGPTGLLNPNGFEVSHNAPNQYSNHSDKSPNKTPTKTNSAGCSTPNCSAPTVVSNIVTNTSTHTQLAVTKPITSPQLGYTSNYARPVGVTYPSPIAVAPITLSTALPLLPTGTYNSDCKTANCNTYPASEISADNVPFSSSGVINLQEGSEISDTQYTSGLNGPIISIKPSAQSHKLPSTVSSSTNCQTSDCTNLGSTFTGSNVQVGSNAGSKQNLPGYTSGFGAPPGLLNPYDVSIPAGSLKPNEYTKPSGTAASLGCTTGYCDPKPTLSSSPSHNSATSLSGTHASASSSASASAVAYTGGFGGPPGIFKPYDNDKTYVQQNYGKSHVNSPHDKKSGTYSTGSLLNTGSTSQIGGPTNFGSLAGSIAGSYSGSGATSNVGPYGYNHLQPHPAGNGIKTASPCGGGCGGYQDSATGSGNSAAAVAKSLSSSGNLGLGGSFASSSASAHSSAGSYTKGGYGKR